MHVVTIMRYVIRIKKHSHNRIEITENHRAIIKIESNRKEYESLHPYWGHFHFPEASQISLMVSNHFRRLKSQICSVGYVQLSFDG